MSKSLQLVEVQPYAKPESNFTNVYSLLQPKYACNAAKITKSAERVMKIMKKFGLQISPVVE